MVPSWDVTRPEGVGVHTGVRSGTVSPGGPSLRKRDFWFAHFPNRPGEGRPGLVTVGRGGVT